MRWVLALVAFAHVARADPPPAAPPDAAWAAYDRAFADLARGADDDARAVLQGLIAQWPEHPAAHVAAVRLSELDGALSARAAAAAQAPNRLARGEFVFWSTVGGVWIGSNLCVERCYDDRTGAAVYTLSVGGALGLSVLASAHIRQGEAQLYNSAQAWGIWNTLWANNGFAQDQAQAAVAIGGQVLGVAAGVGLWHLWHPTPGDVALANSGLLWGSVLGAFGQMAATGGTQLDTTVALGDVGLAIAAIASTQVHMSRGRTLLIDIGGVLGTLAGGLIALTQQNNNQGVGASFLVGTSAGLVLGTVLSSHWDAPAVPARVVAARMGTGWGLAFAFTN